MPGQGRVVERPYTADERAALGGAVSTLGETTFDIYLNDRAYWRNVPAAVWSYKLGGYQVLKKWLSYREQKVLGRALLPEEVQHFTDTARRIAAILLLVRGSRRNEDGYNRFLATYCVPSCNSLCDSSGMVGWDGFWWVIAMSCRTVNWESSSRGFIGTT